MKKKIKFLSIIAIIAIIGFAMVSCDEVKSGGTLTIKNETGGTIRAYVIGWDDVILAGLQGVSENMIDEKGKDIANGQTASWKFIIDANVSWGWIGLVSEGYIDPSLKTGKEKLERGNSKTITAKKD